jgi:hypothetical protein
VAGSASVGAEDPMPSAPRGSAIRGSGDSPHGALSYAPGVFDTPVVVHRRPPLSALVGKSSPGDALGGIHGVKSPFPADSAPKGNGFSSWISWTQLAGLVSGVCKSLSCTCAPWKLGALEGSKRDSVVNLVPAF